MSANFRGASWVGDEEGGELVNTVFVAFMPRWDVVTFLSSRNLIKNARLYSIFRKCKKKKKEKKAYIQLYKMLVWVLFC